MSEQKLRHLSVFITVSILSSTGIFACGSTGTVPPATGGVLIGTGGGVSGGAHSGGVSSGGSTVGGNTSGGDAAGGAASGSAPATGGSGAGAGGGDAAGGSGGAGAGGGPSDGGAGSGGGSGGSVSCPSTALAVGDSKQTVAVGSLNRSYNLHIPKGYTGDTPLAVVIDFHPLGSTGSSWAGQSGWKTKADSVGFVTVHPESYNSNNSWNVGMCCQDAQKNQIDDVGFTKAIIEHVQTIACVDAKRVYATGCSNGGGMTYKVACDLSEMIAGAAPVDFRCVVGGSTSAPSCESCIPKRPVSITHFDNTGDTSLVPFQGGLTSFPANCPPNSSCTGMGFPSNAANFDAWQEIAGCTGDPSTLAIDSRCQSEMSCDGGATVTNCVRQGGSHCGNYGDLKIVDTAWDQFQKQVLP